MEFETASEKTVESLISLYSNLGQPEAASGLLIYAKKNFSIELEMSCYENLQRWEDALNDYRMKQLNLPNGSTEDYFVPKLRCLHALSDWDVILNQCDPLMNSDKPHDLEKRRQVVFMAANAALNLGQWEKLVRNIYTSFFFYIDKL
jgi:serine/threonine-protein kinase mTOR